jgi:hypothetical protein
MGHLLAAIQKLEQKRSALRPKPVRRAPAPGHAAKIWRFDEPHRAAEHLHAGAADQAVTARKTDEIQPPDATQLPPESPPAPTIAVTPGGQSASGNEPSAAKLGWRFAAPAVPADYYNLAARLMGQVGGSQRPHAFLLSAVSSAAFDAVSRAALAVVLSAQGNVLWIDTQNIRPTPDAIGSVASEGQNPGWHELRSRTVTWEETVAPTSLAGVSFVGCGQRPVGPDRHQIARDLFEPLRSKFSIVLIGGGLVEESAWLAPHCAAIGLAAAIGQTTRSEVGCALRTLGAAGGSRPLMIAVESGSL